MTAPDTGTPTLESVRVKIVSFGDDERHSRILRPYEMVPVDAIMSDIRVLIDGEKAETWRKASEHYTAPGAPPVVAERAQEPMTLYRCDKCGALSMHDDPPSCCSVSAPWHVGAICGGMLKPDNAGINASELAAQGETRCNALWVTSGVPTRCMHQRGHDGPHDASFRRDMAEKVADEALADLTEAQQALVLLANQLEMYSVPFVPDAEAATFKARKALSRDDELLRRGMEAASQAFAEARAQGTSPAETPTTSNDKCAWCENPTTLKTQGGAPICSICYKSFISAVQAETPRVSDEELAAIIADPKPHYVVDLLALDLRDTRIRLVSLEAENARYREALEKVCKAVVRAALAHIIAPAPLTGDAADG